MTISLDEIGIWQNLGTVTPIYDTFVDFSLSSMRDEELMRVSVGGDTSNIKSICYFRQKLGNDYYAQWTKFFPASGTQTILLPFPSNLKGQELLRSFSLIKKSYSRYGPLGADRDSPYTISLSQFIPFTIGQPSLSDEIKTYLDEIIKKYIEDYYNENVIGQDNSGGNNPPLQSV